MNESYVECMVKQKTQFTWVVLKYALIAFCFFFVLYGYMSSTPLLYLAAIACGVGIYFAGEQCNLEYEYLYLDREITVDKVINKSKRKRVAVYSVEKIEIFAPIKSYHLDDYKNRTAKVFDFSSGVENQPDHRFVFFYDGKSKIILEPNPEMVKALKNVAPRKVFLD